MLTRKFCLPKQSKILSASSVLDVRIYTLRPPPGLAIFLETNLTRRQLSSWTKDLHPTLLFFDQADALAIAFLNIELRLPYTGLHAYSSLAYK